MLQEGNSPALSDGMRTMTVDDMAMDDSMRTPTMRSINVADAYDWQNRANAAEQKLSVGGIQFSHLHVSHHAFTEHQSRVFTCLPVQ